MKPGNDFGCAGLCHSARTHQFILVKSGEFLLTAGEGDQVQGGQGRVGQTRSVAHHPDLLPLMKVGLGCGKARRVEAQDERRVQAVRTPVVNPVPVSETTS